MKLQKWIPTRKLGTERQNLKSDEIKNTVDLNNWKIKGRFEPPYYTSIGISTSNGVANTMMHL